MSDVNGHPDRLPDLRKEEVTLLTVLGRRAKNGEEIRLYNDDGDLVGCPVERGEIERPNIQPE